MTENCNKYLIPLTLIFSSKMTTKKTSLTASLSQWVKNENYRNAKLKPVHTCLAKLSKAPVINLENSSRTKKHKINF